MPKMVAAECIKLKRNSILSIVILGSFCSVVLAVIQLLGAEGTQRGFQELNDGVIWNNVTLFFPALLTLMAGYTINREYMDDTLKNNLVVGVTYRKMMVAKIITNFLLMLIVAITNFGITVIISEILGYTLFSILTNFFRTIMTSFGCYVSVLPIVLLASLKRNNYLGDAVLAFAAGICGIFVANTKLVNIYPITASLAIVHYNSKLSLYRAGWGCVSIIIVFMISIVILMSGRNRDVGSAQS
ncbi:MAG TPA: ABC transporter permease [Candidatus Pelethocola excrementipullorum]|nr:ABC transporter permease [Candidatus Pelethocola excrementipullorum]